MRAPTLLHPTPLLYLFAATVAASLALGGCAAEPDPRLRRVRQAVGVPQDGFPSWSERLMLVLTNRARSDPAAESQAICGGGCASYPPSAPLEYSHDRGRAARFQATSLVMAKAGLQHASVCALVPNLGTIYPSGCDGSPSCACQGGSADCTCTKTTCLSDADCPTGTLCDKTRQRCYFCNCGGVPCTSTFSRVALFGASTTGENAAAGSTDPLKTFAQWVKSPGHWANINQALHGTLGTGHFNGSGGCWKSFWVQVFGGGAVSNTLVGGAHYPESGGLTTTFQLRANYYDSGAPQKATVNIDGTCHPMTLERGTGDNGTYRADKTIGSTGCHRYYFSFRDAGGTLVTYPSQGSYGVGVGATSCPDYSSTARPPSGSGCGCAADPDCEDGDPCTQDSCSGDKCQHMPIAGCCAAESDCDDSDPCTQDSCVAGACQYAPVGGCGPDPAADSGVPPDSGAPPTGGEVGVEPPVVDSADGGEAPPLRRISIDRELLGGCSVAPEGSSSRPGPRLLPLLLVLVAGRRSRRGPAA